MTVYFGMFCWKSVCFIRVFDWSLVSKFICSIIQTFQLSEHTQDPMSSDK